MVHIGNTIAYNMTDKTCSNVVRCRFSLQVTIPIERLTDTTDSSQAFDYQIPFIIDADLSTQSRGTAHDSLNADLVCTDHVEERIGEHLQTRTFPYIS